MTRTSPTLLDELTVLHASFVEAVNAAITDDDPARAHELAAAYDAEAVQLVAEREAWLGGRRP